jgi:hypothetical protein
MTMLRRSTSVKAPTAHIGGFIASCALHYKLPNLAMYNVQILLIVSDIDIARLLILGTLDPGTAILAAVVLIEILVLVIPWAMQS